MSLKKIKENDDTPCVSVIMSVYNQRDAFGLEASINSILKQSFEDVELLIWDDGSDSEANMLLERALGWNRELGLSNRDKRISYFHKDTTNNGLAHALNQLISHCRGKYIARMDADDVSDVNRLKEQYEFLESHPEYDWCGTNAVLFDEKGEYGQRVLPEVPKAKDYLRFSPFIHPSVMFRSSLFETEEAYSEDNKILRCEDLELFARLHLHGHRGYNLQNDLFYYREDRKGYKRRSVRARWSETTLRWNCYKKMGIPIPLVILCGLRPMIGGLIPNGLIYAWKRLEGKREKKRNENTAVHK